MISSNPNDGGNIQSGVNMDSNKNQPNINPEGSYKSMFDKCCPCLSWKVLQPYLDVTTHDIKKRLMGSLIPFNQKFY